MEVDKTMMKLCSPIKTGYLKKYIHCVIAVEIEKLLDGIMKTGASLHRKMQINE